MAHLGLFSKRYRRLHVAVLSAFMFALADCSESPTAPHTVEPIDAGEVLPAVVDARVRLTASFDPVTNLHLSAGLADLEIALRRGDAEESRFQLGVVTAILDPFSKAPFSSVSPDVSAIELALDAVGALLDFSSPQGSALVARE